LTYRAAYDIKIIVIVYYINQSLARLETGKEQAVRVRRNEGVAIHIGPKPCAGIREDVGEASAGECIGQPLVAAWQCCSI
jgi:hypothetical protein